MMCIACGGDGTVGWVLSVLDEMDFGGGFTFGVNALRGIQTVGFVVGLAVVLVLIESVRSADRLSRVLFFGVIPSLVMISFSSNTYCNCKCPTKSYDISVIGS